MMPFYLNNSDWPPQGLDADRHSIINTEYKRWIQKAMLSPIGEVEKEDD